jgi:nucleoside-diphosphate-sugar epimerase
MNAFVAGASGAIGRPLVAEQVRRGHTITGITRSDVPIIGQGEAVWSWVHIDDAALASLRSSSKASN